MCECVPVGREKYTRWIEEKRTRREETFSKQSEVGSDKRTGVHLSLFIFDFEKGRHTDALDTSDILNFLVNLDVRLGE
jgi:hypothetical protein